MTTYFKIAPSMPDALPEPPPPLSLFCTLRHLHARTHTHATQIRKSHDVLNDTPETFYHTDKVKLVQITFDTQSRL